jgi:hypothetical protein
MNATPIVAQSMLRVTGMGWLFSSEIATFVPKVRRVTSDDVRAAYRWCLTSQEGELADGEQDAGAPLTLNGSVTIVLDAKQHKRLEFRSLAGQSGWANFRLLTVETIPEQQYLLSAAINGSGEWIEGSRLEGLFDFVTKVQPANEWPDEVRQRLEIGLDWHKQISIADWQLQWSEEALRKVSEALEQEVAKIATFENELGAIKRQLRLENCSTTREGLAQRRTELRATLLDAERRETELTKALLTQQTSPVQSNIMNLFSIEWEVYPAPSTPIHNKVTRRRRRRNLDDYF